MTRPPSLERFPVHLGLGAKAVPQPEFAGADWYALYAERCAADGAEGRLVAIHRFAQDWTGWEMHPAGDELVVCIAGALTLHQELPGGLRSVTLHPGEYAVNPPGAWHTADVPAEAGGEAAALFVTAGMGTQHRPR